MDVVYIKWNLHLLFEFSAGIWIFLFNQVCVQTRQASTRLWFVSLLMCTCFLNLEAPAIGLSQSLRLASRLASIFPLLAPLCSASKSPANGQNRLVSGRSVDRSSEHPNQPIIQLCWACWRHCAPPECHLRENKCRSFDRTAKQSSNQHEKYDGPIGTSQIDRGVSALHRTLPLRCTGASLPI